MKKIIPLLISPLILGLVGCTSPKEDIKPEPTPEPIPEEKTPEELIEAFFNKVDKNCYRIFSSNFITVNVYSPDLAFFNHHDPTTVDTVYMTVNHNELFKVSFGYNEPYKDSNITYEGEGKVVDHYELYDYTLYSWEEYIVDNVWDHFTNHPDDPLRFTMALDSIGGHVINTISNIPNAYKSLIKAVDLVLDDEDISGAKIDISFNEADGDSEPIEDRIIDIDFDIETDVLPTDGWYFDENRTYPEGQTEWSDYDKVGFKTVFDQIAGKEMNDIVPFPSEFATRTFYRIPNMYGETPRFALRDTRATKEGMEEYASKLVNEYGYEKHQEKLEDGTIVDRYDRLIRTYRDTYFMYSSIYLEYDNGVSMLVNKRFNIFEYYGRDTLNEFLKEMEFPQMEFSSNNKVFYFFDETFVQCCGYTFHTPYKKAIQVEISFENYYSALAYMEEYGDLLVSKGFIGGNEGYYSYSNEDHDSRIKFEVLSDAIHIEFWYVEYYSKEYVSSWLEQYEFPTLPLEETNIQANDATLYYQYDALVYQKEVMSLDMTFITLDDRNEFMETFVSKILNEGFEEYNPLKLKIARRDTSFYNESKRIIIAYDDNPDSRTVDFHLIRVSDDFQPRR